MARGNGCLVFPPTLRLQGASAKDKEMTSRVFVALRVPAAPARAFEAFTREIACWWRSGPLFRITPQGDGELVFEPGADGRLVTRLSNGATFEIGRISVWEPGKRLVFAWRQASFAAEQSTEVEVLFEPAGRRASRSSTGPGTRFPGVMPPGTASPSMSRCSGSRTGGAARSEHCGRGSVTDHHCRAASGTAATAIEPQAGSGPRRWRQESWARRSGTDTWPKRRWCSAPACSPAGGPRPAVEWVTARHHELQPMAFAQHGSQRRQRELYFIDRGPGRDSPACITVRHMIGRGYRLVDGAQ